MHRLALSFAVLFSFAATAEEVVYQFRSVEDPAFPPDDSICADAPFPVNVKLGASLWSTTTRAVDGKVMNDQVKKIGKATACVELTNFLFPAGLAQNFYVVFDLPSGSYTAVGTCTLTSNNVPLAGLVLAGCALNVVDSPNQVQGGVATSASTFNPAQLAGFNTGSAWTLHVYKQGPNNNSPHNGSNWQWHQDNRSNHRINHAKYYGGKRKHNHSHSGSCNQH